jgi:tumor protein p53-inducible protein 3
VSLDTAFVTVFIVSLSSSASLALTLSTMRAIVQTVPGNPSSLMISKVPIPEAGFREIMIKVECTAVNRMDLLQAKGSYPVPAGASTILGVEVSGTVVAIGDGCQLGFQLNEKVAALLPGGGYAEFCVCDERTVIRPVGNINMQTLAAIPEAFMTAYQLCFLVGNAQPGETAIFHAAASSIGQAAIQLLVRKGVKVFCTVRGDAKRLKCLELGATGAFNVGSTCRFADLVREHNAGKGANIIIDSVGSSYLEENIKALELEGRLLVFGLMGGAGVDDPAFLSKLMAKRISLLTSTLRSRSVQYKEGLLRLLANDPAAFPAVAAGDIKVEVDRTFDLADVMSAHEYMARNENSGKNVLLV